MPAEFPKCCGTCQSIRYRGPQEVYQEAGECAKSAESGQLRVRWEQEPCPCWKLRPAATRKRDEEKARLGQLLINKVNRAAQSRRRLG